MPARLLWLENDIPTFQWVYSEETLAVYETDASIVTSDPARFPDTGRIRVLSPVEAVAAMSGHAGCAERAAGLPLSESAGGPTVQGWPT